MPASPSGLNSEMERAGAVRGSPSARRSRPTLYNNRKSQAGRRGRDIAVQDRNDARGRCLVNAPTDRQPPCFLHYLRAYRRRNQEQDAGTPTRKVAGRRIRAIRRSAAPGERHAAGVHRSLPVLYRELYRVLKGHRGTISLALLSLSAATLLKLVPPASTKGVIDYALHAPPLPPAIQEWCPFPIPDSPRLRLANPGGRGGGDHDPGHSLRSLEPLDGDAHHQTCAGGVRRRVYEHAMRLPLHRVYELKSGGATSLLREDAGGMGELIFSMLYNPWRAVIQFIGRPGRAGLGRLAAAAGSTLPGARVSMTPTALEPANPPALSRRPQATPGHRRETTEAFGGMRVVRAFGRQRSESARFMGENHLMARQELHVWWLSRLIEMLWEFALPMASAVLLLYGGLQVLEGRLSLGDLMMFLVYLTMLLEPLAVLATSVTQFQTNLAGFDRVLDLLQEPREMADRPGTSTCPQGRGRRPAHPGASRLRLSGDQSAGC